jgi:hypothetical protein
MGLFIFASCDRMLSFYRAPSSPCRTRRCGSGTRRGPLFEKVLVRWDNAMGVIVWDVRPKMLTASPAEEGEPSKETEAGRPQLFTREKGGGTSGADETGACTMVRHC